MRAYVVSLARRPERLAAFHAHIAETGLREFIDLDPFVALDGSQLDLESLKPRISPSNLSAMTEGRLRSISAARSVTWNSGAGSARKPSRP